MIDANGLALAHVYGQPPDAVAFSDRRLTDDEAEKLARLIVRLPELIEMGDMEKTAGLTIREPDGVDDARPVHFTKWKPFDPDAVSHRAGLAPASAETDPGMGGPVDANASLRSDPELISEAAE